MPHREQLEWEVKVQKENTQKVLNLLDKVLESCICTEDGIISVKSLLSDEEEGSILLDQVETLKEEL